jgi:hypothetical protein
MAYIPTRADFADVIAANSKGGYVPTAADFSNISNSSSQPQNFLSEVANNPITQRINDIGGNVAQGLERGVAGIGNLGLDIANKVGVPTGGFQIHNYSAPFVNPNDKIANFIGGVAQYAPLAATSEAGLGALGLSKLPLLKNMLSGAISGYGATNSDQTGRLENAAGGAAAGTLPSVGTGIVNAVKGINMEQIGANVAKSFFGSTVNPGELNNSDTMMTFVKDMLKNNYIKLVNLGSSKFQDMFNLAKNRGYSLEDDIPSYKSITDNDTSSVPDNKTIRLSSSSSDQIDDILNDKNIPLKAKKVINAYKDNPNLQTLHSMQSDLYKTANGLNPKTILESNSATKLTDLRDSILKDIHNSFENNGDLDLSAQYKQAQQFWKSRVVPYQNNSLIRGILSKKSPSDVLSKLSSYQVPDRDENESYQMIRDDIASNPSQVKTLTGAILSKAASGDGLKLKVTTKDLLDAYRNTPQTLKNITDQVALKPLTDLHNIYTSKNIVAKFMRENKGNIGNKVIGLLGKGALMGAGGAGGYDIYKYLE